MERYVYKDMKRNRKQYQKDWYARNKDQHIANCVARKHAYRQGTFERKDPINQKCIEALPWNHACFEHSDKSINDVINDTLKKVEADKIGASTEELFGGE